jgi:hypothetical protein
MGCELGRLGATQKSRAQARTATLQDYSCFFSCLSLFICGAFIVSTTAILLFLLAAAATAPASLLSHLPLATSSATLLKVGKKDHLEKHFIAPNAAVLGEAAQESVSQLAHSVSLTSFIEPQKPPLHPSSPLFWVIHIHLFEHYLFVLIIATELNQSPL